LRGKRGEYPKEELASRQPLETNGARRVRVTAMDTWEWETKPEAEIAAPTENGPQHAQRPTLEPQGQCEWKQGRIKRTLVTG
jgi:hypothetical protein